MGEVEYAPGEPKGTPWHPHRGFETVTYIIDGTFEHAGLPRRRRHDHQRRHPVDDRRRRRPAHRAAAGAPRRQRRPVPRPAALGEPAPGAEVGRAALPGPARERSPCCWPARTPARSSGSSPGDVAGHQGPGSTYTPMAMVHATVSPGATLDLPWRPDFNALVYVLSGAGSVGIDGAAGPHRPARRLRPRRHDHDQRRRPPGVADAGARRRHPRRRADPRAGRHVRAVRHEHPAGGHGRVHRLPGRPARLDPGARYVPHGAVRGETGQTPRARLAIRPGGGAP